MGKKQPKDFGAQLLDHIDSLYGLAMIFTKNSSESEDLVQQTYMKALTSADSFETGSNLKAWLFTILRNIWINQMRSKQSSAAVRLNEEREILEAAPQEQQPDVLLERNYERKQIRRAIENLPVMQREIIVLRDFEGFSYREIAAILGCPIGTVMSRIGRAHATLREDLKRLWHPIRESRTT